MGPGRQQRRLEPRLRPRLALANHRSKVEKKAAFGKGGVWCSKNKMPEEESGGGGANAVAGGSGASAADSKPGLIFDGSSFESANLGAVKLISSSPVEYDLAIRPDTMCERHRVWFYFSVRGAKAGQKVIFNLVGYSKTKSLFREGMAPVVCSSGRPYWERMPANSVYYYRSPRHDRQYVLSFPFCFEVRAAAPRGEHTSGLWLSLSCLSLSLSCLSLSLSLSLSLTHARPRWPSAHTAHSVPTRRTTSPTASPTPTPTCSASSSRSSRSSCPFCSATASAARCRSAG